MPGNGDFFAEWGRARQKCTHFGRFGGIVRSVGGIVRSTSRVLGIVDLAAIACRTATMTGEEQIAETVRLLAAFLGAVKE